MNIKETLSAIENSECYALWQKENPDSYLASIFSMFEKIEEANWSANYYNPADKTITSFTTEEIEPKKEAFTKEEDIPELNLKDCLLKEDETFAQVQKIAKEKHNADSAQKYVFLLQRLGNITVWNATLILPTLKIVNIKISAKSGELVESSETSMSDFIQQS